jgi:hypothetical protein
LLDTRLFFNKRLRRHLFGRDNNNLLFQDNGYLICNWVLILDLFFYFIILISVVFDIARVSLRPSDLKEGMLQSVLVGLGLTEFTHIEI